jgi:hypothetical protein
MGNQGENRGGIYAKNEPGVLGFFSGIFTTNAGLVLNIKTGFSVSFSGFQPKNQLNILEISA